MTALILRLFRFLLTPLREGRPPAAGIYAERDTDFYSRPCGRGDLSGSVCQSKTRSHFYSRPCGRGDPKPTCLPYGESDFYSRPCGRGDVLKPILLRCIVLHFYSRPCGRGDPQNPHYLRILLHFYSRPCGRGDSNFPQVRHEVLRQIAER